MSGRAEHPVVFDQPADVQALYENVNESLPILDEATLSDIKLFLHDSYTMIAGSICSDTGATITEAIKLNRRRLLKTLEGRSFLGPYIDSTDTYYPNGIGYWTTKESHTSE
jgi:hypothetical protein